jgi:hypothetical protein
MPIQPTQSHERIPVRIIFDKPVPAGSPRATALLDFRALFRFEDDLGLLDYTFSFSFTKFVGYVVGLLISCQFFFAEALSLSGFDVGSETYYGLAREFF